MFQSTLSSRNQTTIPKEIRQYLGLQPGDTLDWENTRAGIQVTVRRRAFLDRKDSIKTGPDSAVEEFFQP
jgi:AbrB family looped-hinge helix DNA binding protein